MKQQTLVKFKKISNNIIEGWTFMLSMVAMVLGVYIYQMIDIGLNWNEYILNSGKGTMLEWLSNGGYQNKGLELMRQSIQSFGSLAILVGITLIARHKKLGWLLNVIGNAFIFTNGFLTGLWFESATRATMFALYLVTLLKYDSSNNNEDEIIEVGRSGIKEWAIALGLLIGGLVIAGIITGTNSTEIIGMKSPFLDATQGMLNISAIYLLGRKKTEGQLAFVVSNMFALAMFVVVWQPIMIFSTLSFLLTSFANWISWESDYATKNNNFFYLLEVK